MPRLQILQHKSYHPYLESNKQKVRDDEARARLDEELREKAAIEDDAGARLEYLRRKAADPNAEHSYEGFAGTSSAAPGPSRLLESHRTAKAKADKKKEKEITNFDWPSETKRKEEKRAAKGKGKDEDKERIEREERDLIGLREGEHVNFWADIEKTAPKSTLGMTTGDKLKDQEDKERDPFTMYLGRPDRETKPWYTDKEFKRVEEKADGEEYDRRRERQRRKDERSKNRHDPLTALNAMLAPKLPPARPAHRTAPPSTQTSDDPARTARLAREASERQRALDMIAAEEKKKRRVWEETPASSVASTPRTERWDELERHKDARYQGQAEMFGRRFMDSMGGRGRR